MGLEGWDPPSWRPKGGPWPSFEIGAGQGGELVEGISLAHKNNKLMPKSLDYSHSIVNCPKLAVGGLR